MTDTSVRGIVVFALAIVAACGSVAQDPDAAPPCPGELTACGDSCVNPQSDNLHCGDCNTRCESGYACSAGQCELTCQLGLVACGTRCVDPLTDSEHCGASGDCAGANAGEACTGAEVCDGMGTCSTSCQPGLLACNSTCIDPLTDEMYCGATGNCGPNQMGQVCGPSESCTGGTCVAPLNAKRVFVTSVAYSGAMGGLSGADAICQQHAAGAGLSGVFRAWLADTTASPRTRFTQSAVPYVLVDGTVIANNWADLVDNALLAPIALTELGGAPPPGTNLCGGGGLPVVWSDVNADGTLFQPVAGYDWSCSGYTGADTTSMGAWGLANDPSIAWTSWCNGGTCTWTSPIYCFEQ